MPPHCDAIDGPVVKAARRALEERDVNIALAYVHKDGEEEVRRAFERTLPLRTDGSQAREVADLYFFETVVRIHRAGEGAPYTGLKPAGLDVGPVIPVAERAIDSAKDDALRSLLIDALREEVAKRFERVKDLRKNAGTGLDENREYVQAMLGLQVWSNKVYHTIRAEAHAGEEEKHG
jgi:hypothetical protein